VASGMQVGSHHSGCRSISHAGEGLTGDVPRLNFLDLLIGHLPRPLPSYSGVLHNHEGDCCLEEFLGPAEREESCPHSIRKSPQCLSR